MSRVVRRLRGEGLPVVLLVCGTPQNRSGVGGATPEGIIHVGCVADTSPFYAAADIAVQATYYDACSLATLESLASGLPVITTRANGAAELITHGTDGMVLTPAQLLERLGFAREHLSARVRELSGCGPEPRGRGRRRSRRAG